MKKIFFTVSLSFCFLLLRAQLTVTITTPPFCNNTVIQLCPTITGGTPPYQYNWSTGETTQCINVSYYYNGIYSVTVIDANNLTASASIPIPANAVVQVHTTITPETCSNSDGAVIFDISGGNAPYSIEIYKNYSFISNNDTVLNLSSDHYSFIITDANGCIGIDTQSFVFIDSLPLFGFILPRDLPYSYTINKTDHDCPQLGTAAVHTTGGSLPFTYEWSTIPPQYTDSISGLTAGTYNVTISDATAGCSITESVIINNLNPLNTSSTSTPEVCNFRNGTATIIPSNGIPPYTYIWNTNPVQTTSTATNLAQGQYSVTVMDANMCSGKQDVFVGYTTPVQPNAVATNEICNNNTGSITLTPLLGTPPYSYQWSNGGSTNVINNLNEGYYSFTVNDAQGCSVTGAKEVKDVPPFSVNITFNPETCLAPGTATVNVTGNSAPYTYLWNTNPPQITSVITGLTNGSYICTVTDANNCVSVTNVNIPYDPLVQALLTSIPELCLTSNGRVSSSVFGQGQAPYTFLWNNGNTTQNITNLSSGYYTVTITDANNCSIVKSIFVDRYSNMQLSITNTNASCIFSSDGQATVSVANGTPPFTYRWANGQTTQTTTGLTATWRYGVFVTDANGCTTTNSSSPIGYNNLSCAVQISGKVIKDLDADCGFTAGDAGIERIPVKGVPGYYDLTDNDGNYSFVVPPANYAITHTLPYHTFQLCPVGPIELFGLTAGTNTINNDFYDTVRTALDLWIGYGYFENPRPGFTHQVHVGYGNKGNLTSSAIIEYDYDENLVFLNTSTSNYTHDIVNRKLIFTINNLNPSFASSFGIDFYTPDTVALGTLIKECVSIFPVQNDVSFIDNVQCDSINVVGSFDPNDKRVTPKGIGANGYITREDSVLRYTIRFQNTGTYMAENVAILDTLPEHLDPSTIERIFSSHNVRADFFMNKYLAFYFDNIMLPDSFSNEPESHGFVSFYIKQNPALPHGTVINNRAAIYFDYNEPVITNYVTNTISDFIGINEKHIEKKSILAYPNPSNDKIFFLSKNVSSEIVKAELFDLSGKTIMSVSQTELDVRHVPAGLYFYRVLCADGNMFSGKVIKE